MIQVLSVKFIYIMLSYDAHSNMVVYYFNLYSIKGAGGREGLHQDYLKIEFLVVPDREE